MVAGGSVLAAFGTAHGFAAVESFVRTTRSYKFKSDPEDKDILHVPQLHEGKGTVQIKSFFGDDSAPHPALLLIYTIPPGASEGVHTHNVGDTQLGSFDEFYYIMSGRGEMLIDGKRTLVKPGDHIFTPNGVSHGIENVASKGALRVYLVAIIRE